MNCKIVAASFALVALPVAAQAATARADQRQANQETRIQQGVQSGELANKEPAKLEAGQAKVQAKEDKAKADGVVTPKERAKLAKAQDKQSRMIYKQKHDAQKKVQAAS